LKLFRHLFFELGCFLIFLSFYVLDFGFDVFFLLLSLIDATLKVDDLLFLLLIFFLGRSGFFFLLVEFFFNLLDRSGQPFFFFPKFSDLSGGLIDLLD
jgi:hypothetical protein